MESANELCEVVYPTLEQAFLRVTSGSIEARRVDVDGMIGDEMTHTTLSNEISETVEEEFRDFPNLDLETGRYVGLLRQVWVLFQKRYMLLRSGWFVYLINLSIPIIVAAALSKYIRHWDTLVTCDVQRNYLYSGSPLGNIQGFESIGGDKFAALGPNSSFSGTLQDQILVNSLYV